MTNKNHFVFYTGVTSDLIRRVFEHKQKAVEEFTKKYNVNKLVYYEVFDDIENAILREKQVKGGSRAKKLSLIQEVNPEFRDLYEELSEIASPRCAGLAMTRNTPVRGAPPEGEEILKRVWR